MAWTLTNGVLTIYYISYIYDESESESGESLSILFLT